jgi:hypothetical protein
MPLQKLQFRPGVNREGTTLSNEGGWYDCDKIRFRSGYPEKIGGWQADGGTPYTTAPTGTFASGGTTTSATVPTGIYWGIAKSLWNWINLTGYNLLSVGTNLKFYIQNSLGGNYNDVTPIRLTTAAGDVTFTAGYSTLVSTITASDTTLTVAAGAKFANTTGVLFIDNEQILYTTTTIVGAGPNYQISGLTRGYNGTTAASHTSSTAVVTNTLIVTSAGNGAQANDFVNFSGATSLGGNITALVLNREYQVKVVLSNNTYTITPSASAGAFVVGVKYTILVVGTTDFTAIGAASNTVGVVFTATGAGSGTGTACPNPNSSDTGTGGASTVGNYQLTTGNTTFTSGTGWGAGGWSGVNTGYTSTGWGSPAPDGLGIRVQLRLWSQSNYGEDLIINPRGGAMYYWANNASPNVYDRCQIIKANPSGNVYGITTKSGTAYPDSTCPSVTNFVLVSDASRFTFAFGCNDPTGVYATATQDPMQIRWSDQNTVATWTPAITNQAGGIRLSHGSQIITAIQTRQEILVISDAAIYSFQYLGAPYVWSTQLLADNISIVSPNAVSVVNNVTYWMGADKFYMYSGRVETLPCALRQYIYGNINLTESFQIHSGTNEGYNEIWWFYPSITGTTSTGENGTGTSGSPNILIDRYVIYNHLERTWYYGTLNGSTIRPRTAWLDSPLRAEPTAAIGYTANDGSGQPSTYTNGAVVYHETTVDNNETSTPVAIESYVQSSDFDIGDGHNFGFVWRLIPDITFDGSITASSPSQYPTAYFTVRPRQNPGANYGSSDNPAVDSTQSYAATTTYNVQQFTQQVYVRIRGRQMAFKVSSTALGVQWQLGAPRIDVRPDGRR